MHSRFTILPGAPVKNTSKKRGMPVGFPIPPIFRVSRAGASSHLFQFRLTLIRRNTGIARMREGSLPDTSKQFTELFLMNTGFALRTKTCHRQLLVYAVCRARHKGIPRLWGFFLRPLDFQFHLRSSLTKRRYLTSLRFNYFMICIVPVDSWI